MDILKEEYSKLVMIIHPEVDILDRLYETDIIPIRLRELIESNGKEERSSEDQVRHRETSLSFSHRLRCISVVILIIAVEETCFIT